MFRLIRTRAFPLKERTLRVGLRRVVNQKRKFQISGFVCQPPGVAELTTQAEETLDVDSLVEEYQLLQAKGILPDLVLFNKMLKAYSREKNILRMQEIDEAMTTLNIAKNEESYTLLIRAYLEDKNITHAEKTFYLYHKQAETKDPDIYFAMIRGYCGKKNVSEASIVLRLMAHDGMKPDLEILNHVIGAAALLANYSAAWHCFKFMDKINLKPDITSWNHLIDCLCRADKLDEALVHFRNLESRYSVVPDSTTYEILIVTQVKRKWIQESEDLFIEMRNKGLSVNQRTWKYMIEVYARSSQMDKAFILVDQMLHEGVEPSKKLLPILLRRCNKTGKMDWYTQRFGDVKSDSTVLPESEQTRVLAKANQSINYDWDVPGSPFSLLEFQAQLKKKKQMQKKKEMEDMEKQFMLTIPSDIRAKMEEKQEVAAKKRYAKTGLPKSRDVAPTRVAKKKLKWKKKLREPKPDPFVALENAQKPKKRLTTPKDTRMPRSQFYWGRHRGPVVK